MSAPTAFVVCTLLVFCAFVIHTRFGLTPDDRVHKAFWDGHRACWRVYQALPGEMP